MYRIVVSNSAEKDLEKLTATVLKKIGAAIDHLAIEPGLQAAESSKGRAKICGAFVPVTTGSFT